MKVLYLDCFCGASGDMLVGALLDAGADFRALETGLQSLDLGGYSLSADKVDKHGIVATQFRVTVQENHDHPLRHLKDILAIIDGGDLPEAVKSGSAETLRRIAECEAAAHGTTPDKVHFHEVGAVDSIIDIVGAHFAKHALGVERTFASPLCVGFGTVRCAHGILPVPAPATAALLKGVPSYGGDVEGELVTPTGAALVSHWAGAYGPMPEFRIEAIGYGCGTRDIADRANVLRALVGDMTAAAPGMESITVVEANVDDMPSELLSPLIVDLLGAGARDAFIAPIVGKKGRPGHLITALCDDADLAKVAAVFFHSSTTLGIRIRTDRRICLAREWKTVETPWGAVRVKIGRFEDRPCRTAPEFEDCRALAEAAGVSVLAVYEQALAAAVRANCDFDSSPRG